MKRINPHTLASLNKVADSLYHGDEMTRKIVFSLHDCYGLKALDAYIATYQAPRESFKVIAGKLQSRILSLIYRAYKWIKNIIE